MRILKIFSDSIARKYAISGIVNTAAGYATFLIVYYIFAFNILVANAIGYAAFAMNHYYVFKHKDRERGAILRFIPGFIIAFLINQVVLWVANVIFGLAAAVAQIVAMISYTLCFYLINRYYVFR